MKGGVEVADEQTAQRYQKELFNVTPEPSTFRGHLVLEPCQKRSVLEAQEQRTGRPCPYVALEPENEVAAGLLSLVTQERFAPLVSPYLDITMWAEGPERKAEVMQRVTRVVSHPEIQELLWPKPQEKGKRRG